jgi:hypothetical protein
VTEGFAAGTGSMGALLGPVVSLSMDVLVGLVAGALVLLLVSAVQGLVKRVRPVDGQ